MLQAEVYAKKYCPNCIEAIALLQSHNIPTMVYKLDGDPSEETDTLKIVSKHELFARVPEVRSVPQVFINSEHVGGLSELKARIAIEP